MIALPGNENALQSLRYRGYQFPSTRRQIHTVDGATYRHHGRTHTVGIDTFALAGVGRAYTGIRPLRAALAQQHVQTAQTRDVLNVVRAAQKDGLIWGFSGFATADPRWDYVEEAKAMLHLLVHLRHMRQLPSLMIDGGVSEGVLGLSGVLADRFGVPNLGYVPLQGLDGLGPRLHLVMHKDTYQDREILVGLTPDVLVCVGGAAGTIRECEAALSSGGVVLMMAPREPYGADTLPGSYRNNAVTRSAADNGTLIPYAHNQSALGQLERLMGMVRRVSLPSRVARLKKLAIELA